MTKKAKKYWYVTEVTACVLCGREKRYRYRVYTKPKPQDKIKYDEDACGEHFC